MKSLEMITQYETDNSGKLDLSYLHKLGCIGYLHDKNLKRRNPVIKRSNVNFLDMKTQISIGYGTSFNAK